MSISYNTSPIPAPIAAPINRLGVNIPPEPPLPIDTDVAIIFRAIIEIIKIISPEILLSMSILSKLSPLINSPFSESREIKSEVTSKPFPNM